MATLINNEPVNPGFVSPLPRDSDQKLILEAISKKWLWFSIKSELIFKPKENVRDAGGIKSFEADIGPIFSR